MIFSEKTLASLARFGLIGWNRKKESSQEAIGFFKRAGHFFRSPEEVPYEMPAQVPLGQE